ncbi:unnamed protein product [Parajaminaea phylloscopi]
MPASASSSSSKRRSDGQPTKDHSKRARTVKAEYKGDGSHVEAILVDSPSFQPPEAMNLYSLQTDAPTINDSLAVGARPASSPNVVVESNNYNLLGAHSTEAANQAKGYAGQYAVGLYDPAKQTVTLHTAPLLTMTRTIVKDGPGSSGFTGVRSNFASARRDLGELFGNRKQKLAMRNADRMKVDTTGMDESVLQGITQSVVDAPKSSRTTAEGSGSSMSHSDIRNRPIPFPHLDATTPDAVYPLAEVFPQELSSCINPRLYLEANDADHIHRLLPQQVSRSQWLTTRLWSRALASRRDGPATSSSASSSILKTSSSHQRQQTKLLLYIALLWSLRIMATSSHNRSLNDRKSLREKLRLVPRSQKREPGEEAPADEPVRGEAEADTLIDGVLARFCEQERGKGGRQSRYILTPFGETKLLATVIVLCLHIDGFQLDIETLSSEMALKPAKLNELAKSVGCVTRSRVVNDVVDADGQSTGTARGKAKKVMALKCPVKLPEGNRKSGPPSRK